MSLERVAQIVFFVTLVAFAAVVAPAWLRKVGPREDQRRPRIEANLPAESTPDRLPLIIKAIISVIVLIFSFVIVLLRSSSEETRKWATGIIGIVIGFWLGNAS